MSNELERVGGIGPVAAINLNKAGVKTIEEIAEAKPEDLAWIKGIGIISAKKIIENANDLLKLEKNIQIVLNSIKESFVKSCPKCGGSMKSKYIILGPERRLKAKQCTVCKFYLPE
ncbi:MAG: helix-hairpin-helix domain-containing protein [Candidatus Lokiarchaeota archaeon]|nr:helix-hairpin-helix domain-containing protein [Candidatus Lokiarchaeota archaeon]